jgi:threonyl-tRNA synthetase
MGYKIREAQLRKIPYMLVMGDREAQDNALAVRHRTDGDQGARSVDDFIADARAEISRRT